MRDVAEAGAAAEPSLSVRMPHAICASFYCFRHSMEAWQKWRTKSQLVPHRQHCDHTLSSGFWTERRRRNMKCEWRDNVQLPVKRWVPLCWRISEVQTPIMEMGKCSKILAEFVANHAHSIKAHFCLKILWNWVYNTTLPPHWVIRCKTHSISHIVVSRRTSSWNVIEVCRTTSWFNCIFGKS